MNQDELNELIVKTLIDKINQLEKELDYSKMFHCPNFLTTDNGYIACNLDKHLLQKELDEALDIIEFFKANEYLNNFNKNKKLLDEARVIIDDLLPYVFGLTESSEIYKNAKKFLAKVKKE